MDHTKEPWEAFQKDEEKGTTYWRIRFDSNSGDSLHGYCGEANARRIVACVNACREYTTDYLEGIIFAEVLKKYAIKIGAIEIELPSLRAALAEKTARIESLEEAWDIEHENLEKMAQAVAERTAHVERLREALEDRTSFYYERGVPHQSQHPHCRCRGCVDKHVKEALAATAPTEETSKT